jgi:hypothetical protein
MTPFAAFVGAAVMRKVAPEEDYGACFFSSVVLIVPLWWAAYWFLQMVGVGNG